MIKLMEELTDLSSGLDEKMIKSLKIDEQQRLLNKLEEHAIHDEELLIKIHQLNNTLISIQKGDKKAKRIYIKNYNQLKKQIQNDYGIVAKGTYRDTYSALGMIYGIGIGFALNAIISTFVPIGLILGMTIGMNIGLNKEKAIEKEGKLY